MKGFIECNDHTWILFLCLFSCDAQQEAHATKKWRQAFQKLESHACGCFLFPKCHESSNALHCALKFSREIRGGHYEKCNVRSCGHFVFEMWAFLYFPVICKGYILGIMRK